MEFISSPDFQKALATVILGAIGLLVAYLTQSLASFVRQKTTAEQIQNLTNIASLAVLAVEQYNVNGTITNKKQSAVNLVQVWLTQLGITGVTAQQIDSAIESAVFANLSLIHQPEPEGPHDGSE